MIKYMSISSLPFNRVVLGQLESQVYLYKGIYSCVGGGNAENVTVPGATVDSVCLASMGQNASNSRTVFSVRGVAPDTVQIRFDDLTTTGDKVNLIVFA